MWGQMANAGLAASGAMGARRAGQVRPGGGGMGQPQKMAFDTSGSQGGAGMGINMMNAQKNPWETQQANFGMMGPQQGYGQRYRGLGPSAEAMDSMQTQLASWNQGKQRPRMGIMDNFRPQMGQPMMPHQEEVGRPDMNLMAARGIAPTSPYDQMMMSSRNRMY